MRTRADEDHQAGRGHAAPTLPRHGSIARPDESPPFVVARAPTGLAVGLATSSGVLRRAVVCALQLQPAHSMAPGESIRPGQASEAWQWVPRSPSYRTRTTRQVDQYV